MAFAFDVVDTARAEEPDLVDEEFAATVREMVMEAVDAEAQFAQDLLGGGVAGAVDGRHARLPRARRRPAPRAARVPGRLRLGNPLAFMELQDVQELSNFFERRVSAYQVGVAGAVTFDDEF